MSSQVSVRDGIVATVAEEGRALRAFLDILEREYEALQGQQFDALFGLAEEKNVACTGLGKLSMQRSQALAAAGVAPGRVACDAYMQLPSSGTAAAWADLIALTSRARELNQRSGTLISAQLQHNQQALAVLLSAADQAALYGADGQSHAAPSARHFGSA